MSGADVVRRLVELSRLRAAGALDDDEFTRLKRKVFAEAEAALAVPASAPPLPDPALAGSLATPVLSPSVSMPEGMAVPGSAGGPTPQPGEADVPRFRAHGASLDGATRNCAYCGEEMGRGRKAECTGCGWREGLVPVAESRDSHGRTITRFDQEQPMRGARLGLVLLTTASFFLFVFGMGENVLLGLGGLALLALAIWAWAVTRFGTYFFGLPPGKRALAKTVVYLGRYLSFCLFIGIIVNIFFRPRIFD